VKEGSTEVTTTYDGAGLPTSSTDGTTYYHDQVGDLTSIDRSGTTNDWSYGYDPYGRMTCAKKSTLPCSGTGAITFKLDALDRLVSRTGSATSYTWSGLTENPAKIVAGATTTYAYARSGSPLGQKVVSGKTTTLGFYLSDPHGDVVGMAAAGAVTGSRSYDPWGKPLAATGSSSSLGFQGDLTDSDTGQVDMGARYYEPTLGRFSSRDVLFGELTNPVSLNQYVYGADSPLTFSDPTGMMWAVPHTSGCAAGDASCLAAVDWADAWFAAHPLPAPVSEPMPFDPGHFRTWTNNHAAAIRYASDYFDVPRSVIAGVLATEHQLDKRSRLKALGETGAFGLCGGAGTSQGLAELCAEVSFGAGQIQLRRAQALDSAVRQAVQAFYGTGAWDYSDMGILSRLEDENTNILYVAAFMDSLRAGAPAGSHWGEIYEGLGNTSPVENYQPPAATRFVSGFAASENYYLYLDRDPMWGADRSGLNFEISPIYDFNPVAPLWNPWTS
jgi:RHS repeat-associated protein